MIVSQLMNISSFLTSVVMLQPHDTFLLSPLVEQLEKLVTCPSSENPDTYKRCLSCYTPGMGPGNGIHCSKAGGTDTPPVGELEVQLELVVGEVLLDRTTSLQLM